MIFKAASGQPLPFSDASGTIPHEQHAQERDLFREENSELYLGTSAGTSCDKIIECSG